MHSLSKRMKVGRYMCRDGRVEGLGSEGIYLCVRSGCWRVWRGVCRRGE